MPKLVCVQCQLQYKVTKNGNYVIDMFHDPPRPYKIQNGDRWECPGCGHQIIAGFAEVAIAEQITEHWQEEFAAKLEKVSNMEDTVLCYEKGKVPM